MRGLRGIVLTAAVLSVLWPSARARAEDLWQAWDIALRVDKALEASRDTSRAAGFDASAARSERLPQLATANLPTFLTSGLSFPGAPSGGTGTGAGAAPKGQQNFMISLTTATVPIYTGGRIRNTIDVRQYDLNAARADESREMLDLKLDVASSYVGVLRAMRSLQVAKSSVVSLGAQVKDVSNLVDQGRGIRNDLLAAQVSLANAQQREIQQKNNLDVAWATYNRLLCRPLDFFVPLADLTAEVPPSAKPGAESSAVAGSGEALALDEQQFNALTAKALAMRPELAGLNEQALSLRSQAHAERASTKPQASFFVANIYQNTQFIATPDFGAAGFSVSWTMFDGGRARKRSTALNLRASSVNNQHADLASQIALQVRTAWLSTYETRRRIPVTRAAIQQSEENLRVARNRYLAQRGTNTEVLDAETLRVQSYNNYFNAVYDAVNADFNLHRSVGDL